MPLARFYVEQPIDVDSRVSLEGQAAQHLLKVLRLKPGDECILFNGLGGEYRSRVDSVARNSAELHILAHDPRNVESPLHITLVQAIAKGERMDWILQKSVELGVQRIQPVFSRRSVVHLKGDRLQKKHSHWRRVLIAACEQSGRNQIPALLPALGLSDWLGTTQDARLTLYLDPLAETSITSLPGGLDDLRLLVGPEGGFDDDELTLFKQFGFHGVRLGPRILRTETAAMAAVSALQSRYGDWR